MWKAFLWWRLIKVKLVVLGFGQNVKHLQFCRKFIGFLNLKLKRFFGNIDIKSFECFTIMGISLWPSGNRRKNAGYKWISLWLLSGVEFRLFGSCLKILLILNPSTVKLHCLITIPKVSPTTFQLKHSNKPNESIKIFIDFANKCHVCVISMKFLTTFIHLVFQFHDKAA